MFTIEEYIAKRKEEDNLNEFNKEKKIENIKRLYRLCFWILYLLYNTDVEFRKESYDCHSKLIKKYPYLKNETEMIYE